MGSARSIYFCGVVVTPITGIAATTSAANTGRGFTRPTGTVLQSARRSATDELSPVAAVAVDREPGEAAAGDRCSRHRATTALEVRPQVLGELLPPMHGAPR